MRISEVLKDMIYGAGGAIATRIGAGLVMGFVPASLTGTPFAVPLVQAGVAIIGVRMLGKKFLGQRQGDIMMLGGLISAGLAAADAFLPNLQSGLQSGIGGIIRLPVAAAPAAMLPAGAAAPAGMSDVYDVPGFDGLAALGLGDVYDVNTGAFNNF